jgi:Flp pilus assembly protein CpaB
MPSLSSPSSPSSPSAPSAPSGPSAPSALSRVLDPLDRVRRRLRWHRRPLAAVAAGLAAYVVVQAATAPPPPTVPVWTAAHDLPGGAVLTADDLVRRRFTPQSVPAGRVTAAADAVGRTLAAPVRRGAALTGDQLVAEGWLRGRPGLSAVPVRITDPTVVPLLHAGDRVDLVAADPQQPTDAEVLGAATVLAVPAARPDAADGALPGRLVLVGVPPGDAARVAAASAGRFLTVVWNH